MINLDEIATGDVVTVTDGWSRARGQVIASRRNGCLYIVAFGQELEISRPNRNGNQRTRPGITVVEHQPQLIA